MKIKSVRAFQIMPKDGETVSIKHSNGIIPTNTYIKLLTKGRRHAWVACAAPWSYKNGLPEPLFVNHKVFEIERLIEDIECYDSNIFILT